MVSFEDDDLAGLEAFDFDGQDDRYEAEFLHGETVSSGAPSDGRANRKRARDDIDSLPLMEGEGKSLRVLGFNQRQRAEFVQVLMRFGVGKFDWAEFVPRLKQKTYDEIENYGQLFFAHVGEEINDSPTFSDGVPKEGIRVDDVLHRVGDLLWIQDKVKCASDSPGNPLFDDSIILRYPTLKGGRVWKQDHDLLLLRAVLKHGYTRWQAILDDKDLTIEEVICQELNLPVRSLSAMAVGTYDLQKGTVSQNNSAVGVAPGGTDTASLLFQFKEMQRRQVEFVKNRVVLLGKGLDVEHRKKKNGDWEPADVDTEESKNANNGADMATTRAANTSAGLLNEPPQVISVAAAKEVHPNVYETDPRPLELIHCYESDGESDSQNDDESDSQSDSQSDDQREFSSSDDSGESDGDLGDLIKSTSTGKTLEQELNEFHSSLLSDGIDSQNDDQIENLSSGLVKSASTDKTLEQRLSESNSSLLDYISDDDLGDLIKSVSTGKTLEQRLNELYSSFLDYWNEDSNNDHGDLNKKPSTGKTLEQRLNGLYSSLLDHGSNESSDDLGDLNKNPSTGKTLDQRSNELLGYGGDKSGYLDDLINKASTGTTAELTHNEQNSSPLNDGSGDDGDGGDGDDGDDGDDDYTDSDESSDSDSDFYSDDEYETDYDESDWQ